MMDEGLIVDKIEVEIQSGKPIYDFWMNDSDFIGTHPRYNDIVGGSLTDFMAGEGKDITNPNLDLKDFIGLSFATFTDGKLYQLPDQQFANLYWFRYDWFQRPELKAGFKKQFGYELGVPVNWSAYEDIADFFTNTVKEIDGQKVYGHMDYGKKDPSLGWRFTDAWLSMAGNGDRGLPNGSPWTNGAFARRTAFRADPRSPRRRRQWRGGRLCPDQIRRVAEEIRAAGSGRHGLPRSGRRARSGACRAADLLVQRVYGRAFQARSAGDEQRRHAEVAHGPEPARRLLERGHEARLSGRRLLDVSQICADGTRQGRLALWPVLRVEDRIAEESRLRSLHVIRESDISADAMTELAPKVGGWVEFYRSPARKLWTPTGVNVPEYGKLAQVWWQNVSQGDLRRADPAAGDGRTCARPGRDHGASREVRRAGQARAQAQRRERPAEYWYDKAEKDGNLAPQRKLANEKPPGITVDYDELIKSWKAEKPKG